MKKSILICILTFALSTSLCFAIVGHGANQISSGTFGAGDYIFSGIITATNFSGDGSSITNIKAPWAGITGMPAGFSDGIDDSDTLWVQSGSDVYRSSGKVGILDATPDAALDVLGSVTFGSSGNIASGVQSTAIGYNAQALANYGVAMGYEATAGGPTTSTAMGRGTIANGSYSTAMGYSSSSLGTASTAMGRGTASGGYSTAMGFETFASGDYSTAMGRGTTASSPYSTAIGYETIAANNVATAIGYRINVTGSRSFGLRTRLGSGYYTVDQDNTVVIMTGTMGINVVDPDEELEVDGDIKASSLSGSGNAYVCADANGKIYRSATACV